MLLLALTGELLCAQEGTGPAIRAGLGIYLETPRSSDAFGYYDYPSNRISIPVRIQNALMLEPETGFYYHDEKEWKERESGTMFGLGLSYAAVRGRMVFYPGIRTGLGLNRRTSDVGGSNETTSTYSTFLLGPALGVEYFLADRLSLGGELGLKYAKTTLAREPDTSDNGDSDVFWFTDTGVRLRFYFGK